MRELSSSERLKKAGKKFFLFFALALVSILIPVAHFVLVPLFFLLSFVFGWMEYRKKFFCESKSAHCIHCSKGFDFSGSFAERSVRVFCSHCGSQNSLEL